MVIRYNDILTVIRTVGEEEGIGVTITESAKGGLIAGASCFVGGVVGGPAGLAVGGALGGAAAAFMARDKFKPVSEVLAELPEERREALAEAVRRILGTVDAGDAVELVALVQGNALLKAKIAQEMVTFLAAQVNVPVVQGQQAIRS